MNIPPRIDYYGDQEKALALKGQALNFWASVTHPNATGKVKTNTVPHRFQDGTEFVSQYSTDAQGRKYGRVSVYVPSSEGDEFLSGFLFYPRYTAEDEALDPAHIEGEIKISPTTGVDQIDWLRTDRFGFREIVVDQEMVAGRNYWLGKGLISWNQYQSDAIKYLYSDGHLYENGKKIADEQNVIYGARRDNYILAVIAAGYVVVLDTRFTIAEDDEQADVGQVGDRYARIETINLFANPIGGYPIEGIKRSVSINSDGTKMVLIAFVDASSLPVPFYYGDPALDYDHQHGAAYPPHRGERVFSIGDNQELIIEYDIELTDDPEDPIAFVVTNTTWQFGLFVKYVHTGTTTIKDEMMLENKHLETLNNHYNNLPMVEKLWFDHEDVLQKCIFTNISFTDEFNFSSTFSHPFVDGGNVTSTSATSKMLVADNPYINNPVIRTVDIVASGADYLRTVSDSKVDLQGKLVFPVVSDVVIDIEYDSRNHSKFRTNEFCITTGVPEVWFGVFGVIEDRYFDESGVLSDKFGNALYFFANLAIGQGYSESQIYYPFRAGLNLERQEVVDDITVAIKYSDDILGVV